MRLSPFLLPIALLACWRTLPAQGTEPPLPGRKEPESKRQEAEERSEPGKARAGKPAPKGGPQGARQAPDTKKEDSGKPPSNGKVKGGAEGRKAGKKGGKPGKAGKVEIGVKTKDAEIPIPEGATEEDIRVIRGANAMLRAERRLGKVLKSLKVKGAVQVVPFPMLDGWAYEDGFKGMPKEIFKIDGKKVVMAGFMLPIFEVENIKSFYLVKSLWSCCYGVPPDVNGLVKINVKAKKGIAYQYDPIIVVGTFRLKKVMDEDYCVCLYQLDADMVRVLEPEEDK